MHPVALRHRPGRPAPLAVSRQCAGWPRAWLEHVRVVWTGRVGKAGRAHALARKTNRVGTARRAPLPTLLLCVGDLPVGRAHGHRNRGRAIEPGWTPVINKAM